MEVIFRKKYFFYMNLDDQKQRVVQPEMMPDKFYNKNPDFHWLSLIFTDFHRFSLTFTDFHWLSQIFTDFHWFSLTFTDFHWLSLIFTDFHWFSLTSTLSFLIWMSNMGVQWYSRFQPLVLIACEVHSNPIVKNIAPPPLLFWYTNDYVPWHIPPHQPW